MKALFISLMLLGPVASFAQEPCVGNPDKPVTWQECLIDDKGTLFITGPQYGTQETGFLPLHGYFSLERGLDFSTADGYCAVMKRTVDDVTYKHSKRSLQATSLRKDGSYAGSYRTHMFIPAITCKRPDVN